MDGKNVVLFKHVRFSSFRIWLFFYVFLLSLVYIENEFFLSFLFLSHLHGPENSLLHHFASFFSLSFSSYEVQYFTFFLSVLYFLYFAMALLFMLFFIHILCIFIFRLQPDLLCCDGRELSTDGYLAQNESDALHLLPDFRLSHARSNRTASGNVPVKDEI